MDAETGKHRSKAFSVKKYGEERAKLLAQECRESEDAKKQIASITAAMPAKED